jgi:ribose 1,5-bisphosphokinase PhnN
MRSLHVSYNRLRKKKGRESYWYIDKNLSREDQLTKLRGEVTYLDEKYKADKLEFDAKEKLQQEAFNVSI